MADIKYEGIDFMERSKAIVERIEKEDLFVPRDINSPSLIIFGENNIFDKNEAKLQKDVAHLLQSKYILHERLRNYLFNPKEGTLIENPRYSNKLKDYEVQAINWENRGSKNKEFVRWGKSNLGKGGCKINRYEQENFGPDFESNLQIHLAGLRSAEFFIGCGFSYMQALDLANKYNIKPDEFNFTTDENIQKEKEARISRVLLPYAKKGEEVIMVVNKDCLREESIIHKTLEDLKKTGIESLVLK